MAVCEAYVIRPYPVGRKFIGVLVRFYPMNQKSNRNWIHSASGVAVCGAYAIRPYTGDLKNGDFSFRSTTGVAVCRAYAVAPYTVDLKNGVFSIRSTTAVVVYGAYAIRPYTEGRKLGWFLVCFWPGKGKMTGDSINSHPRKGVWGCSIVVVRFLDHMPGLHFEVTVDYIDG